MGTDGILVVVKTSHYVRKESRVSVWILEAYCWLGDYFGFGFGCAAGCEAWLCPAVKVL
jgi:hypothetical protein